VAPGRRRIENVTMTCGGVLALGRTLGFASLGVPAAPARTDDAAETTPSKDWNLPDLRN
jgi:hypothetical protein